MGKIQTAKPTMSWAMPDTDETGSTVGSIDKDDTAYGEVSKLIFFKFFGTLS